MSPAAVKERLEQLKKEYGDRQSPMIVLEENGEWKMSTRERYLTSVRKITPHMEFPKTLMETLAVIAWKQPILQADVIRIRTNKAYDHIIELEKLGFVVKEKFSRTYKLKLTQKFFDYFDLRDDKDIEKMFTRVKRKEDVEKELQQATGEVKEEEAEEQPPREEVPEDEKEETVYDDADREDLEENDEITPEEEGFMEGEEKAGKEKKKKEKEE